MPSTQEATMGDTDTGPPLLQVENLHVRFETRSGHIDAVNGISYHLDRGESLGIVGESGSGKTVSVQAISRLLPTPPAIIDGRILLDGRDILQMDGESLRLIRGNRIAVIFQDPMTSLNPVLKIRRQMTEAVRTHLGLRRRSASKLACDLLGRVGIPDPQRRLDDYPHQFSGGQRQRIGIAMALMCEPDILIADEPTTALDVTIQAQIMELVADLQDELRLAVLWITHDLGVAANLVQRVMVMYAGRIIETGPTRAIFGRPGHPYTLGLLKSLPRPGTYSRLASIRGQPPDLSDLGDGCHFEPRCDWARAECLQAFPDPTTLENRMVACYASDEVAAERTD